jgi:hypothetical protein
MLATTTVDPACRPVNANIAINSAMAWGQPTTPAMGAPADDGTTAHAMRASDDHTVALWDSPQISDWRITQRMNRRNRALLARAL